MNKLMAFIKRPWLSICAKVIYTALGKPYFKTLISQTDEEIQNVNVNVIYNIHFIYFLDNLYEAAGVRGYDRTAPPGEKIAMYLYESISNIAEPHLPVRRIDGEGNLLDGDELDDIPPMSFRDNTEPVTTRIDLDDPDQYNDGSRLDIMTG